MRHWTLPGRRNAPGSARHRETSPVIGRAGAALTSGGGPRRAEPQGAGPRGAGSGCRLRERLAVAEVREADAMAGSAWISKVSAGRPACASGHRGQASKLAACWAGAGRRALKGRRRMARGDRLRMCRGLADSALRGPHAAYEQPCPGSAILRLLPRQGQGGGRRSYFGCHPQPVPGPEPGLAPIRGRSRSRRAGSAGSSRSRGCGSLNSSPP
jgi:hypothetical protein